MRIKVFTGEEKGGGGSWVGVEYDNHSKEDRCLPLAYNPNNDSFGFTSRYRIKYRKIP